MCPTICSTSPWIEVCRTLHGGAHFRPVDDRDLNAILDGHRQCEGSLTFRQDLTMP
jgi:hypothetical protein